MPYDKTGEYTLPDVYLAEPGHTILIEQHNDPLEDIQNALNQVVLRNGSTPITGNQSITGDLSMNSNRITGLADGKDPTDAVTMEQALVLQSTSQQNVSGPVSFSEKTTVPSVTDWTQKQAVPASDADARYMKLTDAPFVDMNLRFQVINATVSYNTYVTWPRAFASAPVFAICSMSLVGSNERWPYIIYSDQLMDSYGIFSCEAFEVNADGSVSNTGTYPDRDIHILVAGYF